MHCQWSKTSFWSLRDRLPSDHNLWQSSSDGANIACPADAFQPHTFLFDAAITASDGTSCDLPECCTGTSAGCPAEQFQAAQTVCRVAADVCDVSEVCSGTSPNCPANSFAPSTQVCRAAVIGSDGTTCDITDYCTGSSASCPPDQVDFRRDFMQKLSWDMRCCRILRWNHQFLSS